MNAFIKAISYYLPEYSLSNEKLNEEFPEWDVKKISLKTGINKRRIAADNEFASDMAIKSSLKLFKEHKIDPKSIDFILYCTQSPDYFLPSTSCIIQDEIGVPTTAGALDFNLGCSGFVYGLSLAKGLIATGEAKNVLLITSETYSKHMHPMDRNCRTIFGDAAATTLISTNGDLSIGHFVFGTDGERSKHLIVTNGGMRNRELSGSNTYTDGVFCKNDDYLFMNGKAIFNFTAKIIPELVEKTLSKNALSLKDIDLHVFHQANRYILNFIRKIIKIPEKNFFVCMENCGNTVSSTIPIALVEAKNQNKLNGNILLAGYGVGLSWSGTVLKSRF